MAWAAYPPLDAAASAQPLQPVVCLHDAGSGSREWQTLLQHPPAGTRLILIDWPRHGKSSPLSATGVDKGGLLSLMTNPSREGFVKGHDLSRADKANKMKRASAPAIPRMRQTQPCQQSDSGSLLDLFTAALHSTLNQLAISKAILLGSGFGAAVATHYASLHSGAVLGLILARPAGLIDPRSSRTRPLSACIPILAKSRPEVAQTSSEAVLAGRRHTLRLEAIKQEMQPLLDAAESELKQTQPTLRADLAALKQPILFTLSRHNRKYPLRDYIELLDPLLDHSPQHRITVFTGSLHPAWDEPQRFAQAVNGFVQSQLPLADHHHAWLLTAADYPAENMNLWKCVHPECSAEQALPAESNPNAT